MKVTKNIKIVFCTLLLVLCIAGNAFAGAPTEAIKGAVTSIIEIISDKKYDTMENGADARYADLEKTVDNAFDFIDLSARSVGKPWLKFTEKERVDFVDAFSTLLKKTYIQKLGSYNGEKVNYLQEKQRGNRAMVLTKIQQDDKQIPVNYKLVKKKGNWRVYDVIVEGVSLIKNYRTQFSKLLRNKSPEEVIAKIQERIQKIELKESKESESEDTFTDIN